MLRARSWIRHHLLSLPIQNSGLVVVALLLLALVVLAYAPWLARLGFFGNDWPYVWYYHRLGPLGPGEFAAIDRPASTWFYAASMIVLGESAWPYHLFLLGLRWAASLLFWQVLRLVWPNRPLEAVVAASLMAVYPSFLQTPVAVQFILHFAVLDLFLASLCTSFLSVTHSRRFWLFAVLTAAGAAGVFWLEYFAALEILRPLLLWVAAARIGLKGVQRLWVIVKAWLPALLVSAAFLTWRVFIFKFPTYQPVLISQVLSDPLQGLATLARWVARGVWVTLPQAWRQVLVLPAEAGLRLPYLVLVLVTFILVAWFFWKNRDSRESGSRNWGETTLGIGLLVMLVGGVPYWVTGIPFSLDFPWDRPTLSLIPGACLVVVGLVSMIITVRYRYLVVAAMVSLAVGMHFLNGYTYLKEWQKLQSFTWQLVWRAPGLEAGTLLLFDVVPLNRYSDSDLTALLNWTYAPDLRARQLPYRFFDLTIRLDQVHSGLPGIEKGLVVQHDHRGTMFTGSTSQVVVLDFQPPACLKLFAANEAYWPGINDRLASVLPLSDLQFVLPGGGVSGQSASPPAVIGAEPQHDWCYYFQKAELAMQQEDWAAVVGLAQQARLGGWQPALAVEWLPFIKGYAYLGQWEEVQSLAAETAQSQSARPALCGLWREINRKAAAEGAAPGVFLEIGCKP